VDVVSNSANTDRLTTQMIRSRRQIRMEILPNGSIDKIRLSIFGREDDVKENASERLRPLIETQYENVIICVETYLGSFAGCSVIVCPEL